MSRCSVKSFKDELADEADFFLVKAGSFGDPAIVAFLERGGVQDLSLLKKEGGRGEDLTRRRGGEEGVL